MAIKDKKLIFPKFYLITPDFKGDEKTYLRDLEASLNNGIRMVQFRSKNMAKNEYIHLAKKILNLVRSYGGKLLLNGDVSLLMYLDVDGIHFPTSHYLPFFKRPISKKHLLSLACHNKEQLRHAEKLDADFVVLCPVFVTPSSPMGNPIGWYNFSDMLKSVKFPVYALGGLNYEDIDVARSHGAYGIAAKRGLWGLKEKLPI